MNVILAVSYSKQPENRPMGENRGGSDLHDFNPDAVIINELCARHFR
jgi:hypothetical protein